MGQHVGVVRHRQMTTAHRALEPKQTGVDFRALITDLADHTGRISQTTAGRLLTVHGLDWSDVAESLPYGHELRARMVKGEAEAYLEWLGY